MAKVKVNDGDLAGALEEFKRQTRQEGIVGAYKRGQQFFPDHAIKARKERRAELRRRRKARGDK